MIYGIGRHYVAADEGKLGESDLAEIKKPPRACLIEKHLNFVVTRLTPDRFDFCAKAEHLLLRLLKPLAPFLAGRVPLCANFAV